VLVLYYRWVAAVPILPGRWASGRWGRLPWPAAPWRITALNSTPPFSGTIIGATASTSAIVLLARYVEARAARDFGRGVAGISLSGPGWDAVGRRWQPLPRTFPSVAMDFRGFRQFGVIGRAGMVLCWIPPFACTSLIAWLDKGRLRPLASGRRVYAHGIAGQFASRLSVCFRVRRALGLHSPMPGFCSNSATSAAATNWSFEPWQTLRRRELGFFG